MASGSVRTSEKVSLGPRGKWDQALEAGKREKSGQKERSRALQTPTGQGWAGAVGEEQLLLLGCPAAPPQFSKNPLTALLSKSLLFRPLFFHPASVSCELTLLGVDSNRDTLLCLPWGDSVSARRIT